jgi:hypothetical protein
MNRHLVPPYTQALNQTQIHFLERLERVLEKEKTL